MSDPMGTGLLVIGALLLAMGWFTIGWVARGEQNRKYTESRLRHLAAQAALDRMPVTAHRVEHDWPQQPAPVVNVHLHTPAVHSGWSPVTATLDTHRVRVVPEIEGR